MHDNRMNRTLTSVLGDLLNLSKKAHRNAVPLLHSVALVLRTVGVFTTAPGFRAPSATTAAFAVGEYQHSGQVKRSFGQLFSAIFHCPTQGTDVKGENAIARYDWQFFDAGKYVGLSVDIGFASITFYDKVLGAKLEAKKKANADVGF